ncbi:hypothetical protein ACWDO6_18875 [Streptomyces sp. NPDC003674]
MPVQLAVADGKIAVVRLSPTPGSRDPEALIIHETGLPEALVALFHAYRERAWRLAGPGQPGSPRRLERRAPASRQRLHRTRDRTEGGHRSSGGRPRALPSAGRRWMR